MNTSPLPPLSFRRLYFFLLFSSQICHPSSFCTEQYVWRCLSHFRIVYPVPSSLLRNKRAHVCVVLCMKESRFILLPACTYLHTNVHTPTLARAAFYRLLIDLVSPLLPSLKCLLSLSLLFVTPKYSQHIPV